MSIKCRHIGTAIFLLFIISSRAFCQGELLAKDFSSKYDPEAEIDLKFNSVTVEDQCFLYLNLTIRHTRTKIKDLVTTYAFLDRYSDNLVFSKDTLDLSRYWINNIRNQHYFNLQLSNPSKKKILILRILNRQTDHEFYFDIPIDPDTEILNTGVMLRLPDQNWPFFRNYIKSEPFVIANLRSKDSVYFIFRYTDNFPVAAPPFSADDSNVGREISIDSTFSVKTGQKIKLKTTGLYFIQHDTTGVNGFAFRNEKPFFPRLTTHDELIESLVYLATNLEINRLEDSSDKKSAFQKYWLDITESPDRAQKVIRDYYRRISDANELFTNYKRGWKTDQGMIYVIFGPPDVVHKDDKKEEWIYERTTQIPRISFEFLKIESIFTHDHYVLVRKRSYQQIWYKAIDLWRKGQKEI